MMTLIMAAKETSYFGEDLLVFLLSLFGKWGVGEGVWGCSSFCVSIMIIIVKKAGNFNFMLLLEVLFLIHNKLYLCH